MNLTLANFFSGPHKRTDAQKNITTLAEFDQSPVHSLSDAVSLFWAHVQRSRPAANLWFPVLDLLECTVMTFISFC